MTRRICVPGILCMLQVAGTKRCWVPEVGYLGLVSEEKALSRWIAKMFRNMRAQYTVGILLLFCATLCSLSCMSSDL